MVSLQYVYTATIPCAVYESVRRLVFGLKPHHLLYPRPTLSERSQYHDKISSDDTLPKDLETCPEVLFLARKDVSNTLVQLHQPNVVGDRLRVLIQ